MTFTPHVARVAPDLANMDSSTAGKSETSMKTLLKIKLAGVALAVLGTAVTANHAVADILTPHAAPHATQTPPAPVVFTGGVFSIGRYSLQAAFTPDGTSVSFSLRNATCG